MSLAMASLLGKTSARRSSDSQRSLTAVPSNPSLSRSTWPANRLPKLEIMMVLRVKCRAHYARAAARRPRQVMEGGALHPSLDHPAHVGAESQSMEQGRPRPAAAPPRPEATMRYERISADCHIDLCQLPPDLFTSNASAALRDRMPYVTDSP